MTTNRIEPDHYYYYKPNEFINKKQHYSHIIPNNTGFITNRSKHGPYNITEKDYGNHKLFYYVPSLYEDNYDMSQLDEIPVYEEPQKYHSPTLLRRRYYPQYDDNTDYIEELPMISPRRPAYISPRRSQAVKKVYYESPPSPPPLQTIEYIYEDEYRPKNEEIIEYIVEDHTPRPIYIEEVQPIRPSVHVENLPPISRSPIRTSYFDEIPSPRRSKLKQQTPRLTAINKSPNRLTIQNNNEQKHVHLKEIVAQNRARRGSRIPKPRREVSEERLYDLPTYNRNYIKNDFIVHK